MREVLRHLGRILEAVPEQRTRRFERALLEASRVFVYGLGRSGLVARAFGMRLVHLGRDATIVGDTTTPAIRAGDLLVICSRTARSPILHHALRLAHREGASVVAVVAERGTTLAQEADLVVRLPLEAAGSPDIQPLGSRFEQTLLLYLDSVVLRLMVALGIDARKMEQIHSNLP
ncbi:MAG: 6-phospho-3-hexuloisomerase [Planctomycetota bacterium]